MADRRASAVMKPMMFESNKMQGKVIPSVPMTSRYTKGMKLHLDEDYFNESKKLKENKEESKLVDESMTQYLNIKDNYLNFEGANPVNDTTIKDE